MCYKKIAFSEGKSRQRGWGEAIEFSLNILPRPLVVSSVRKFAPPRGEGIKRRPNGDYRECPQVVTSAAVKYL